jgi:Mor family transcriptional regulator
MKILHRIAASKLKKSWAKTVVSYVHVYKLEAQIKMIESFIKRWQLKLFEKVVEWSRPVTAKGFLVPLEAFVKVPASVDEGIRFGGNF